MKPKPKTLYIFENGHCACGDETGQQIGELQVPVLQLWCDRAVSLGYDPEGMTLKMELGDLKIIKGQFVDGRGVNWTTMAIA